MEAHHPAVLEIRVREVGYWAVHPLAFELGHDADQLGPGANCGNPAEPAPQRRRPFPVHSNRVHAASVKQPDSAGVGIGGVLRIPCRLIQDPMQQRFGTILDVAVDAGDRLLRRNGRASEPSPIDIAEEIAARCARGIEIGPVHGVEWWKSGILLGQNRRGGKRKQQAEKSHETKGHGSLTGEQESWFRTRHESGSP
jgi:hypothetical protein